MKKVLATGINGETEATAYVGTFEDFIRMQKDESVSLSKFSSVTSTPPDVMVGVSAILCMSAPKIAVQVLSIAEHYSIPIVLASTALKVDDPISEINGQILQRVALKKVVYYCKKTDDPLYLLEIVLNEDLKPGVYSK